MGSRAGEGVHDSDAVDLAVVLEIFAQKTFAAAPDCSAHDQGVPPREGMLAVKIEGGIENIATGLDAPERLDQLAVQRDSLVGSERGGSLPQDDVKPLLHDLIADEAVSSFVSDCEPFLRDCLFAGIGGVDCVDEEIGVQKETARSINAHCALHG